MVKTSKTLITQRYELAVPGFGDFLRGQSGDQFLRTASKDNNCIIALDSPDTDEWTAAKEVEDLLCLNRTIG